MTKPTTVREFFKKFPSDDSCLEHLFDVRYGQGHTCPKCERSARWYKIEAERAYSCQWCGNHLHPTVGTLFAKSRTPLQLWFYAIFLFTTTRHGVSAKELQRQLGVTYKTAWRMGQMIRQHMAEVDGEDALGGPGKVVEVDETYFGGQTTGGDWRKRKTVVMGMLERNGDIMLKVVPDNRRGTLVPNITDNVRKGSEVHTDELQAYKNSMRRDEYRHRTVNHSKGEYVAKGGVTTNTIEGAFSHFKRSISGTHTTVSKKYLERYAKEFEYRFNRRSCQQTMLSELLSTFEKPDA